MTGFYTNWTRLFLLHETDRGLPSFWEFLLRCSPWRIMWNGGKQRVIIREMWTQEAVLPRLTGPVDFKLVGGVCVDPSDVTQGDLVAYFVRCRPNRRWMPTPGTTELDRDVAVLSYWVEFDCEQIVLAEADELPKIESSSVKWPGATTPGWSS